MERPVGTRLPKAFQIMVKDSTVLYIEGCHSQICIWPECGKFIGRTQKCPSALAEMPPEIQVTDNEV